MSVNYIKVKGMKIPIIGTPDRDGRLSEEDYKATLKLNRHYIELACELVGVNNELNKKGGSINSVQGGGWVTEAIKVIKFLAPILKPYKDKFVNWYDKKYEEKTGKDAYDWGLTREQAQPQQEPQGDNQQEYTPQGDTEPVASGYIRPGQGMDYTLTELRKHIKGYK